MATNLVQVRAEIDALVKEGASLLEALHQCSVAGHSSVSAKTKEGIKKEPWLLFTAGYLHWYAPARAVIKQLLPDHLNEFDRYYEPPSSRKNLDLHTYCVKDALVGRTVTDGSGRVIVGIGSALPSFIQQIQLLKAARKRLESSLYDITRLVQADLFDSELEAASELASNGFLRAAGVVAGVVLERHLAQVCSDHKVTPKKKNPTISTFNDAAKDGKVISVIEWRRIQLLGDIRNKCGHSKGDEPTSDEVNDLIAGAAKVIKTLS